MDIHIIVKLKSSYEAWHNLFLKDADNRSNICDESRTLVGQVNESTAVITLFEVNKAAMEGMMTDPEFKGLITISAFMDQDGFDDVAEGSLVLKILNAGKKRTLLINPEGDVTEK